MTVLSHTLFFLVMLLLSAQVGAAKANYNSEILRSFRGSFIENGTEWNFTLIPPELDVQDDHAIGYFTGWLSSLVIPIVYLTAVCIGVPANCLLLCSLWAKSKCSSSDILYVNLAVADLLLLVSLAFKIHYHLNSSNWVLGETMCRVVTACFYGSIYCCIHMHMSIVFNRYLAVVHPFTYRSLPKRLYSTCNILLVWIIFFITMVPELIIRQSYYLPKLGITSCHDVLPPEEKFYTFLLCYKLALNCFGFFLPFLITVIFYTFIIHHLNRSQQDWVNYIRMRSLVFAIFILCFTPNNVIHFVHYMKLYTSSEEHFYIYYNATLCLCSLHCCLDPFLFFLMSRTMGLKLCFITFKGRAVSLSI